MEQVSTIRKKIIYCSIVGRGVGTLMRHSGFVFVETWSGAQKVERERCVIEGRDNAKVLDRIPEALSRQKVDFLMSGKTKSGETSTEQVCMSALPLRNPLRPSKFTWTDQL